MTTVGQQHVLRVGAIEYIPCADGWLTIPQARYALTQLWSLVAGNATDLAPCSHSIQINACSRSVPYQLLDSKQGEIVSLYLTKVLPGGFSPTNTNLPLLFATTHDAHKMPCQMTAEGNVQFHIDLVALTFFMLTRWEETTAGAVDRHGRFPASASVAHRHGFLQRPILDEWSLVVRKWILHLNPGWNPILPPFQINLTCDVDHPLAYPNAASIIRRTGSALLRKRAPRLATRHAAAGVLSLCNWRNDPYYQGLKWLLDLGEHYAMQLECNFMAAPKSQYDEGYNLGDYRYSAMLQEVLKRGHRVGLHAGYNTYLHADRFCEQKQYLERIAGQEVLSGRQHYLQFKASKTWKIWDQAGMKNDSTVGFAEAPGFRCGTCRSFETFDLENSRPLGLTERSLIAMDVTFLRYQLMDESSMTQMLVRLGNQCRKHSGIYTLLIHNDMDATIRYAFEEAIKELMEPHLKNLG